jgi:acetyl-CoA synthetase
MNEAGIEALFTEDRTFAPPPEFVERARAADRSMYESADADWQGFWASQANELHWFQHWETVLEWNLPFARWFIGGTLNVSYNCIDRHVLAGKGDKVAFHWEGEPGDTRTIT